jgi:hypothetical protein
LLDARLRPLLPLERELRDLEACFAITVSSLPAALGELAGCLLDSLGSPRGALAGPLADLLHGVAGSLT